MYKEPLRRIFKTLVDRCGYDNMFPYELKDSGNGLKTTLTFYNGEAARKFRHNYGKLTEALKATAGYTSKLLFYINNYRVSYPEFAGIRLYLDLAIEVPVDLTATPSDYEALFTVIMMEGKI